MFELICKKLEERKHCENPNRILTRNDLVEWLSNDAKNYPLYSSNVGFKQSFINLLRRFFAGPLSDQKYIWKFIKTLRYTEYYLNTSQYIYYLYYLHKLRKYSRITGLQIEPNTVGKGLSIYHFGTLIINEDTRIGNNLMIQPQVVFGWDGKKAPKIGNNVTIFGGSFIYGDITIGDNVTIGCNSYVCKDIPSNCVVAGTPAKIIKYKND